MISGHGDMETAINTMRMGAFDYIQNRLISTVCLKTVRNALDKKETCFREQNFKEKSQKL
jgi:FixJ family two-component response regulator